MPLEFLQQTPMEALSKLEKDLYVINPDNKLNELKRMSPAQLSKAISVIESKEQDLTMSMSYGEWLGDERYVELKLMKEALGFIKNLKEDIIEKEVLVPGFTYYRKVKRFGPVLEGERCYFQENQTPDWVPFKEPAAAMKALEVLRHGTDEDFKKIYIEMANGKIDALHEISLEHIFETNEENLNRIEEYCDGRWDGPWVWETNSPHKLRELIEENWNMRMQAIVEMRHRFDELIVALREGEGEKYEIVGMARDMSKKVDNMIDDLGKLASDGITAAAGARSEMGDSTASSIEQALHEPVQNASRALSALKAAIDQAVETVEGGSEADPMGGGMGGPPDDMGGDDLGTPGDAMGGPPEGAPMGGGDDDLPGKLSDVSLDGSPGERPRKVM